MNSAWLCNSAKFNKLCKFQYLSLKEALHASFLCGFFPLYFLETGSKWSCLLWNFIMRLWHLENITFCVCVKRIMLYNCLCSSSLSSSRFSASHARDFGTANQYSWFWKSLSTWPTEVVSSVFFYLGFHSQLVTNHSNAEDWGINSSWSINSSLPLPHAPQTLMH